MNLNGPEPVKSVICLSASVLATRSGMMKALPCSLASASMMRGNGCLSEILKLLSSIGVIASMVSISF